jgi:hypothetical protein
MAAGTAAVHALTAHPLLKHHTIAAAMPCLIVLPVADGDATVMLLLHCAGLLSSMHSRLQLQLELLVLSITSNGPALQVSKMQAALCHC